MDRPPFSMSRTSGLDMYTTGMAFQFPMTTLAAGRTWEDGRTALRLKKGR